MIGLCRTFSEAAWKGDLEVLDRLLKIWVPKIESNMNLSLSPDKSVQDVVNEAKSLRPAKPGLRNLGIKGLLFAGKEPALALAIAGGKHEAVEMLLSFLKDDPILMEQVRIHMADYYSTSLECASVRDIKLRKALSMQLGGTIGEGSSLDLSAKAVWQEASIRITNAIRRRIEQFENVLIGLARIVHQETDSVAPGERLQSLRSPRIAPPIEFDHNLFQQIKTLVSSLDEIETTSGDVDFWARNLAMIFESYEEVVDYIRDHVLIRQQERGKLSHIADLLDPLTYLRYEALDPLGYLRYRTNEGPGDLSGRRFTRAFSFRLPEMGEWSPKRWRALLLNYPLASAVISQAVAIEAYLSENDLTFPQNRQDFERVLLDYTVASLPKEFPSLAASSLEARGPIVEPKGTFLRTPIKYLVRANVSSPLSEFQRALLDNLGLLGSVGNFTRNRNLEGLQSREQKGYIEPDGVFLELAPNSNSAHLDSMFALLEYFETTGRTIWRTSIYIESKQLDEGQKLMATKKIATHLILNGNLALSERKSTNTVGDTDRLIEKIKSAPNLEDLKEILSTVETGLEIDAIHLTIDCSSKTLDSVATPSPRSRVARMLNFVREFDALLAEALRPQTS